MPLPNPGQDAVPFTTLTAQFYDETIENIESLADGSGFDAGAIPASALASDAGFTEIARTTLGVAGDTISVTSIPARKYLMVKVIGLATGSVQPLVRFNNDSGTNYSLRRSVNGAADATGVSATNLDLYGAEASNKYILFTLNNIATSPKGVNFDVTTFGSVSSGAPGRAVGAGLWANSAAQVSRIDIINNSTGDFAIGSEAVVWGSN